MKYDFLGIQEKSISNNTLHYKITQLLYICTSGPFSDTNISQHDKNIVYTVLILKIWKQRKNDYDTSYVHVVDVVRNLGTYEN